MLRLLLIALCSLLAGGDTADPQRHAADPQRHATSGMQGALRHPSRTVKASDFSKAPYKIKWAHMKVSDGRFIGAEDMGVQYCNLLVDGAVYGQALGYSSQFMLHVFLRYTTQVRNRTELAATVPLSQLVQSIQKLCRMASPTSRAASRQSFSTH